MGRKLLCALGVVGLVLVPGAGADKTTVPSDPLEALKVKVTKLNVTGPIAKAVEMVEKACGLKVVVDWPALAAAGVKPDTKVRLKVPEATVQQVLGLVLAQVSRRGKPLSWYLDGAVVRVTTQMRVVRRYRRPGLGIGARRGRRARTAPPRKIAFNELPLVDVITFFRKATGANFLVNWKALALSGVEKDTPVTLNVSKVSFARALTLVTDLVSAGKDKYDSIYWLLDKNIVCISTGNALDKTLHVRVHDVADLLMVVPDAAGPRINFNLVQDRTEGTGDSDTPLWDEDSGDEDDRVDRADARKRIEQKLITIVKNSIGEDMWQPQGKGSVHILHKKLVISQTDLGFKLMERALSGR